jgi:hypothetical protein
MKAVRKKKPLPVEGQVIGVSVLANLVMMAVSAVICLVCLGLVVLWFVERSFGLGALIAGLLGLVFGSAGVGMGLFRMGVKERLIVGSDRFQVIRQVRGEDEVITQIPYANMSAIKFERGSQSNYVGIDLVELDEPGTYQKNNDFETTKAVRGFHCVIDPGYTEALETIYEMLAARLGP